MKNNWKYLIIGILIGGVVVWVATSSENYVPRFGQMMNGRNFPQSTSTKSSDSLDSHFIEQMIPHHNDAIIMSKIALEKADHEELKTLAQNIIDAQSGEITQMKRWYKDWFGKEVPEDEDVMDTHGMMQGNGRMHMGMMGSDLDIDNLKTAENFDKEFIQDMIPHHQMAVMMATMLKNGTTRPEMKQLSQNIIDSQTKEINQMRLWYKDWGY